MCSFIFSSKEIQDLEYANLFSRRRGPDKTSILHHEGFHFIHNLLSITGSFTVQPFVENHIFCLYNGEIYNFEDFGSDYQSDGNCLIDAYKEYGPTFCCRLDGEFAILIVDFNQRIIIASTDVFGSKPLWIGKDCDENIGLGSYKSSLERSGFTEVVKSEPNTTTIFNLDSGKLVNRFINHNFNLDQYKDSFDDWDIAFKHAVAKRTTSNKGIFIGLSSGLDSGGIACELLNQKKPFNTYSVKAAEDIEILRQRHSTIPNAKFLEVTPKEYSEEVRFLSEKSEDFLNPSRATRPEGYRVIEDKGSIGTGIICSHAQKDGCKIYLSGQGADEIMSDYGENGVGQPFSSLKGIFPEDLSSVFPWENFFNGVQEEFIYKDEVVGGTYGIECRYPFLDKFLVQEFLNLSAKIKNSNYKSPLRNYLMKNHFPFNEGYSHKVGFRANCFS
tara:strand:- start:2857 stop:4188 length:1332 start_codon:yes stop_codon:yes gene_type:complete